MNYLWIDLWDKRSWLAYNVWNIIFSLDYVQRLDFYKTIKKIVLEKNIETIVVGLPYDLYDKDHKQLNKTLKVIERLKEVFPDLIIDSIDERFTTFQSYDILNQMWYKKNEILYCNRTL